MIFGPRRGWRILNALRQLRVAYPLRLTQRVGSSSPLFILIRSSPLFAARRYDQ
jgi:hypothetical protein